MRWRRWQAGALSVAGSYPTSEVRDRGPECQAGTAQHWPGGATLRPLSGVAGRSHLPPEARGGDPEEPPHTRGQGQWPGGATQGAVAARAQKGLEEPSHIEGQEGRGTEIPLVQGKEQWLRFAGAPMKRYSMPKVRETQVRW